MDEHIEGIWKTHDSIIEWIKFSDTKAAVILATNGIILSIVYTNISKFLSLLLGDMLSSILIASLLIGVLLSIVSIFYSISCLAPRTHLKKNDMINLIYFKDIKENFDSSKEYSKFAEKLFSNEAKLKEQIFAQIFTNSNIATIKYEKVKHSIRLLGFAIFFLILPILIFILSIFFKINWG